MANDFTITFPQADLKRFQGQLQRMEKELGKSSKQALQWGAITVCKSIGASTNTAPKKRKIIKATPAILGMDMKGMTKAEKAIIRQDIKSAPYGVMMYDRFGKEVFRRIDQLNVKLSVFRSKTTGELLGRNVATGQVHKVSNWNATNKEAVKNASSLVNIRYAGLCKKMWSWLSKTAKRSGTNKGLADVQWHSSGWAVQIRNMLKYAGLAFGGKGLQPVETAMRRASDSLAVKIDKLVEAQAKKAVS